MVKKTVVVLAAMLLLAAISAVAIGVYGSSYSSTSFPYGYGRSSWSSSATYGSYGYPYAPYGYSSGEPCGYVRGNASTTAQGYGYIPVPCPSTMYPSYYPPVPPPAMEGQFCGTVGGKTYNCRTGLICGDQKTYTKTGSASVSVGVCAKPTYPPAPYYGYPYGYQSQYYNYPYMYGGSYRYNQTIYYGYGY